jgi:hypothetical protein
MDEWLVKKGDRMLHGDHLEKTMTDAGFVDIKVKKVRFAYGDWDGGVSRAM